MTSEWVQLQEVNSPLNGTVTQQFQGLIHDRFWENNAKKKLNSESQVVLIEEASLSWLVRNSAIMKSLHTLVWASSKQWIIVLFMGTTENIEKTLPGFSDWEKWALATTIIAILVWILLGLSPAPHCTLCCFCLFLHARQGISKVKDALNHLSLLLVHCGETGASTCGWRDRGEWGLSFPCAAMPHWGQILERLTEFSS